MWGKVVQVVLWLGKFLPFVFTWIAAKDNEKKKVAEKSLEVSNEAKKIRRDVKYMSRAERTKRMQKYKRM